MGSSTRKLAVAAFSNKTNNDWDSIFILDYVGGHNKQLLVHTHLKSLVDQRDKWHALVIEMDAPELLYWLVAFICERNAPVVMFVFQ